MLDSLQVAITRNNILLSFEKSKLKEKDPMKEYLFGNDPSVREKYTREAPLRLGIWHIVSRGQLNTPANILLVRAHNEKMLTMKQRREENAKRNRETMESNVIG